MGPLHEERYTCLIISRSILLRMRNISDKSCKKNTRFVFTNFFLENLAVYEIVWNNTGQATDDSTIRRMRFSACWIPNATDTHSAYVMLTAFPWQQLLRERASILRYTYIFCLIITYWLKKNCTCVDLE